MHFLLGAFCILLSLVIAAKVLGREKKTAPREPGAEVGAAAGVVPAGAATIEPPGEVLE